MINIGQLDIFPEEPFPDIGEEFPNLGEEFAGLVG
jgi:hypothetical protein